MELINLQINDTQSMVTLFFFIQDNTPSNQHLLEKPWFNAID